METDLELQMEEEKVPYLIEWGTTLEPPTDPTGTGNGTENATSGMLPTYQFYQVRFSPLLDTIHN